MGLFPLKFGFGAVDLDTHVLTEVSLERQAIEIPAAFTFSDRRNVEDNKQNHVENDDYHNRKYGYDHLPPLVVAAEGDVRQNDKRQQQAKDKAKYMGIVVDPW